MESPSPQPDRSPKHAAYAAVELELLPLTTATDEQVADHYDSNNLGIVKVGQPIARIMVVPGQNDGDEADDNASTGDGTPPKPDPAAIVRMLGENVQLAPDGLTILATVGGQRQESAGRVSVTPEIRVKEHVDFSTGNIEFTGDVQIPGCVRDCFTVHATGNVTIKGTIEAAQVNAGGDLLALGGIAGRQKAECHAGGQVQARYVNQATLHAQGGITVEKEINDSRIICGGELTITHGSILSGHVTALGGVQARDVGSPSGTPLLIELGIDQPLRQLAAAHMPQLLGHLKDMDRLHQDLAPLIGRGKHLGPSEKERVTELHYELDEARTKAGALMTKLRSAFLQAQSRAKLSMIVSGTIHPGVTIRFAEVETIVETPLRGPVRIICTSLSGKGVIWACDDVAKVRHDLPSQPHPDPAMTALRRILTPPATKAA